MDQRLKHKTWYHKTIEESTEKKLLVIDLGSDFLFMTPKVQTAQQKINKRDSLKPKIFCTVKETINKIKKQLIEWEKIFANHVSDRGLMQNL